MSSLLKGSLFLEKIKLKVFLILIVSQVIFICAAYATPIINNVTPSVIAQGQTVNAVVSGSNLNENISIVGVVGSGLNVVVLHASDDGKSLTVQFRADPNAEAQVKTFFIGTFDNKEATYPIQVIPADAPQVDFIYPNSGSPGETKFIQIVGKGLTNISSVKTSNTNDLIINTYRFYQSGNILDLSITISPNAASPATHEIFVENISGQQSKGYFNITSSTYGVSDSTSYSDPFSPGIFEISANPHNKSQIILKGTMFSPNSTNNVVTILENQNGVVISRQINVDYSSDNEIVVNLPEDISSEEISLAVTSEGKSSNIKKVELDKLLNEEALAQEPQNQSELINEPNPVNNTTITATIGETQDIIATNPDTITPPVQAVGESPKDTSVPSQNAHLLTQFLFTDSNEALQEKINDISLKNLNNPEKLILEIEESKQIKKQADLIMITLEEAKNSKDKELELTLQKAENLKAKVDELEKLLDEEKKKNKPDRRKLAKYMHLLASTNAESRSQTFTLLNNLLKYKPQLKNLLTQKPFDLATIQPNIPNDSVILQYVPTEEGLIIFVVDNKNLKTRINKNISREILNLEVKAFRQIFEEEIEKINKTGRVTPIFSWKRTKSDTYKKEIVPLKERSIFLYNALIKPVEKDIEGKSVLAIIANGWLRYLPFQALAKQKADGDIDFLISNKSIVYLDSVLALSSEKPKIITKTATVSVIANPDGTLSGANKEAEIIISLFGMSVISHVQKPFSESTINDLSKKSDILHLATHGYLDGSDISASYLISGKEKNEKTKSTYVTKLLLKDIYNLNLKNSKLVVLSGCDTGKLGSLDNEPDDIVGSLATAFRVAGANTILASLWKAHDEATKLLMQNFYKNIKEGFSKAEALRRAVLQVKQNPKYGHPLFWSLFNLIGDWR